MKRTFSEKLFINSALILSMSVFLCPAFAHPGRTDKIGGHIDSATGEYHYHHGHEAHQHIDGVCPFGDYDEWLAAHSEQAVYEPNAITYANETVNEDSINTWEGIGIGLGAAAVASAAGYGVYRYSKKRKAAYALKAYSQGYEYDPHMPVYIANNTTRYHKTCGCCNAINDMQLIEALNTGRVPCPVCCDESFVEYVKQLMLNENMPVEKEQIEEQQTEVIYEMADNISIDETAVETGAQTAAHNPEEVTVSTYDSEAQS